MKRLFLLLVVILLAGCMREPQEGERYLAALGDAIRESDRIVVTEHSFQLDAYDADKGRSLLPEPVVYRTVELSPAQKAALLSTMEGLDPKTQQFALACIFEPHHTIAFHAKGKLLSTMQICFGCHQVQWDGTGAMSPQSLFAGLEPAIKAMGLEPERDWGALAQEQLKSRPSPAPKDGVAQ